jgi:hypothetical protein
VEGGDCGEPSRAGPETESMRRCGRVPPFTPCSSPPTLQCRGSLDLQVTSRSPIAFCDEFSGYAYASLRRWKSTHEWTVRKPRKRARPGIWKTLTPPGALRRQCGLLRTSETRRLPEVTKAHFLFAQVGIEVLGLKVKARADTNWSLLV